MWPGSLPGRETRLNRHCINVSLMISKAEPVLIQSVDQLCARWVKHIAIYLDLTASYLIRLAKVIRAGSNEETHMFEGYGLSWSQSCRESYTSGLFI